MVDGRRLMKRFVLLVLIAALAAVGILYGLRRADRTPHAAVTALLPRGTIALAHFPDFHRTRNEWHQSDLYKLYQEPAVQEFLNKPLSRVPQSDTVSETVSDIEELKLKDAFLAVTSIDNTGPHFAGGFRFHGSQSEAEKIVGKWRSQIVRDASAHESLDYEQHKIDIAGAAPNQIATVYDGQWLFASNDLAELKAVLDRADGRAGATAGSSGGGKLTLEGDDTFHAAMAHMPSSYALLFYLQPKALSGTLTSLSNAIGTSAEQSAMVEQIRSICAAPRFDKGKIRNVLFVGMPKAQSDQKLTRSSLALGSADTVLYLATLLNPGRLAGIDQGGLPLGSWLQKVFDVATRAGVSADDWKAAFDLELGSLADWPQSARWPSIITSLRVKDPVRANKIANALTHAIAGRTLRDHTDSCAVEPTPDCRTRFSFGGIGDQSEHESVGTAGRFVRLQIGRAGGAGPDGRIHLRGYSTTLLAAGRGLAADAVNERGLYAGDLRLCRCGQAAAARNRDQTPHSARFFPTI